MPPKRRRRFQGLYYHSSPPKVFPMADMAQQNNRKRRDADDASVKLSTIRIWMHEKDIAKLTRILWAGQGNRLCQQASTNGRMKRFLAAVPYVMNAIKEVHQAVIDNNLETLQAKLEPPVPQAMVTCKDANGLNVIHKAAGLGHTKILEYLIGIWPEGAHETDITGKTALHWAASAKNNMRCYTILTQSGCDEEAVDYKLKTPSYYRHKPHEIERAFLVYVPEAPRVSPEVATDWEALNEEVTDCKKADSKISPTNGLSSRATTESLESPSEVDLNEGTKINGEHEEAKDQGKQTPEATPDEKVAEKENEIAKISAEEATKNEETEAPAAEPAAADEEAYEDDTKAEPEAEVEAEPEPEPSGDDENTNSNVLNQTAVGDEEVEEEQIEKEEKKIEDEPVEHEREEAEAVVEEGNNEEVKDKKESLEPENGNPEPGEEKPDATEEQAVNEVAEDHANENGHAHENGQVETDELNGIQAKVAEEAKKAIEAIETAVEDTNQKAAEEANGLKDEVAEEANKVSEKIEQTIENATNTAGSIKEKIKSTANAVIDKVVSATQNAKKDQETGEDLIEAAANELKENGHTNSTDEGNSTTTAEADNGIEDDNDDEGEDDEANEDELNGAVAEIEAAVEEHDDDNDEETNDDEAEDTPTSSLAIEGFVHEEAEDNTVQSEIAAFIDEEARIQEIIASGDMEQLAQIVLNGDGNKLLSMQSPEPEIQAFLNNVPNYMAKIRRVHEAAREGSLLALQQALDRRKFAIAKDDMSPDGATPLHVAVLFGHSDIVRYLAARFPETTQQTDSKGRTALHYAATIKDNGHFYNMLVQNGANPKEVDNFGHTAEFYLSNDKSSEILTYRQLLSMFGAEELEEELLNDQGKAENQSLETNPLFKTEQGKYLADTLADPLIGALTEIANKRPSDPLAFLATYLQKYVNNANNNNNNNINSNRDAYNEHIRYGSENAQSGSSKTSSTAVVNSSADRQSNQLKQRAFDDIELDALSMNDDDDIPNISYDDRDEHGQSMLHFACARSHRRGGLLNIIEESKINLTYRDELYRTARDVALQANQPLNAKEIDRYLLSIAVTGDLKYFEHLAIDGYDHIVDITDDEGNSIVDITAERGFTELTEFLKNLRQLEETREELHHMIRLNNVERIKELTGGANAKWLLRAKNYYGRTALHIAILKESEDLVEHFVNLSPDILKLGDNLERTPLHYAMGTNAIESLSRILIQKGAKRTCKDLKGRQPSYYFMNKADILRLQEEEDENR